MASWGTRRLDVFALVSSGQIVAHKWFDGSGWHGTQSLGTGPDRIRLAGLGATSWGTRRLDVFAIDQQTHSLVQLFFDGDWHGPVHQDFNTLSVMVDANPRATPIPVSEAARAAD